MTEETLIDIETRKFELYLESLRLKYETSEPINKVRIVSCLEQFVGSILIEDFFTKPKNIQTYSQRVTLSDEQKNSSDFNSGVAKNIREQAGLSQENLAMILSISQRSISNYEAGLNKMSKQRGRSQILYLNWLKDVSGYNPFGL